MEPSGFNSVGRLGRRRACGVLVVLLVRPDTAGRLCSTPAVSVDGLKYCGWLLRLQCMRCAAVSWVLTIGSSNRGSRLR
jgi:hypothetical protein